MSHEKTCHLTLTVESRDADTSSGSELTWQRCTVRTAVHRCVFSVSVVGAVYSLGLLIHIISLAMCMWAFPALDICHRSVQALLLGHWGPWSLP